VAFHFHSPVRSIESAGEAWLVPTADAALESHTVLACVSSAALAGLVELPEPYREKAASIPYRGVVCALLELDRPLSRYYWTNLAQASPFATLAVIEHTNLVPAERYGGSHLMYLTHYVDPSAPIWSAGVDEIVEALMPTLRAINPAFDRSWIARSHISRDRWAQPVPLVGGSMPDLPLETGLPGLLNASIAHIYPDDRGLALAIRLGQRAAARAEEWLSAGAADAGSTAPRPADEA